MFSAESPYERRTVNLNSEGLHTPRYLLRRYMILHLLRRYEVGRFLEIGCGRAELMPWLARRGFEGVGLEISPEALPLAQETVRPYGPRLRVLGEAEALRGERFRYVFAFEVLEHIEDDTATLLAWRDWLEPGGRLVVTVPAHMKKWTASDDVVGHYRRYESGDLQDLLAACGYTVEALWSYGFPLTALTRPARAILSRSRLSHLQTMTKQDRTLHSSLESTYAIGLAGRSLRFLSEGGGFLFHLLQLPFRHFDLGDGYVLSCRLS